MPLKRQPWKWANIFFLWESYCMLTMKNIFVSVFAGLQFDLYVETSDKEHLRCSILGYL